MPTIPTEMPAIVLDGNGGPEVLVRQTVPTPVPVPGEVLIRVVAAGVNGPDLSQRRGDYPPPPGASALLGLEVAGEIVTAAGEWQVGDNVIALCNGGGYAGYVAVPAGQVLPLPGGWSPTEAAALPETWFTLTQTLVMRAGLEPGMHVLVTGASGGIGGAAILICNLAGAHPLAIVSSDEKAAYALSLGATATIRRDQENVVERTRELTGNHGADRIIDMVGGAATAQHIEAAARGGHIVLLATQADRDANLPLNKLLFKQLTLSGSTLRPQTPATKAAIASRLREQFWPGLPNVPKPHVTTFPLAEAAAAHRAMEDRGHFGKIVLTM